MVKTDMLKKIGFGTMTLALASAVQLVACGTQTTAGKPAVDTSAATNSASAQAALQAALRAYENENLKPFEALLPDRFIGRSLVMDAAQSTLNSQKQIRITLTEIRFSPSLPGTGTQALSAKWDKRFLKLPGLAPTAESGNLQVVMRQKAGQWQLDSLSADNPFVK